MVTEERNKLSNAINKLKRHKNEEAGDEVASGTVVQVMNFYAVSLLSSQVFPLLFPKPK